MQVFNPGKDQISTSIRLPDKSNRRLRIIFSFANEIIPSKFYFIVTFSSFLRWNRWRNDDVSSFLDVWENHGSKSVKLNLNWTFWYFYCSKQIYSHQRVSQQNLIIRSLTFVTVRVQHESYKWIIFSRWIYRL